MIIIDYGLCLTFSLKSMKSEQMMLSAMSRAWRRARYAP